MCSSDLAVICVRGPGIDGRGIARPGAAALAARFIVEPALPEQATFGLRCVPAASLYRDSALIHRGTLSHPFSQNLPHGRKAHAIRITFGSGSHLAGHGVTVWKFGTLIAPSGRRLEDSVITPIWRAYLLIEFAEPYAASVALQPSRKRHRQIEATRERARWGGRSRGGRWAS